MRLVNRFVSGSRNKKIFLKILIICMILVSIELIHVYMVIPLLHFCVIEPTDYQGIEYYQDENYLEFEKGNIFIESFNSYEFTEKCRVTNFYYVNNWTKDNLIYGRESDIYIIDFDSGEYYEEIREFITIEGQQCIAVNEYETYLMFGEHGEENDYFFFAFDDETQNMRYVLATEIKGAHKEEQIKTIGRLIYMNSRYEW